MTVTFFYRDASQIYSYIEAKFSNAGLRMGDILESLRDDGSNPVLASKVHRATEKFPEDLKADVHQLACDRQTFEAALRLKISEQCGLEDVYRCRRVEVSLLLHKHKGLTPIVPSLVERRALVDG